MRGLKIGWLIGVLLLLGALSGCSLFLPEGIEDITNSDELGSSSGWFVAAQGQGGPPGCMQELAPGQVRKVAERLISTKPEAKLLQQALERRGKRLQLGKAHGYKVRAHSRVGGQGLFALEEATEATLIEVPAGADAALYLLESASGDATEWASMRGRLGRGEAHPPGSGAGR
ncbi:MAG: hypothetical protein NUW06_06110 [Candidatus Acetothermia bacterium]|jgi:hypothetical protein|nr:hypothetical protein [Candidatus Acetothermia bacterium]MDH7505615.1 hypothetical protein [Candidatus Acetothermia bacterium]